MSVILKNIILKNFLSVGAISQAVNFDNNELVLILGENLDLGGGAARNGCGKTCLIQGLSYVLFGAPINNIRRDNLINRTNGKNMLVTLDFSVNGTEYKIERGRRPNLLKFYVNNSLQETKDDAQGENKATQADIERILGMSSDMFKHIVALNTYTEPFLAMGSNDQRHIIEQLLGITLLSEKADIIKEKLKINKENIQQEEFNIKAIENANKRVQEQIESLKRRQRLWLNKHQEDLVLLVNTYDDLNKIDIDQELAAHKALTDYVERRKRHDVCNGLLARQIAWTQKRDNDVAALQTIYDKMSHIDIEQELQKHIDLNTYISKKIELDTLNKTILSLQTTLSKEEKTIDRLMAEINTLEQHKCHTCGQDFHDETHNKVLTDKKNMLYDATVEFTQHQTDLEKNNDSLFVLGPVPVTYYKTQAEAIKHNSELESISNQLNAKQNELDPYAEQIVENNIDLAPLGSLPVTIYDTEVEAIEHRATVANVLQQIEHKDSEVDPYAEQIIDMESHALQPIDFTAINEYTKLAEHLKFLLELLTSKDSFVRKRIIDQNLSYLNARLTQYLEKMGLPHTVIFKNDLSVEITELGRELDFHNLSRGEMNRVILGLSFAFRDVWESLYQPINALFIDELLDNGTDTMGMENSLSILKEMNRTRSKSIWLVSHKEELISRVNSVLRVVKEGGFTSFSTDIEV